MKNNFECLNNTIVGACVVAPPFYFGGTQAMTNASAFETALMLDICPDMVRKEKIEGL